MPARACKRLISFFAVFALVFLPACSSSTHSYSKRGKPNFTASVNELKTGGFLGGLFLANFVDVHIHSLAGKADKASCVPEGDWYLGTIKKLKAGDSKAISLPVGQRVYVVVKHVIASTHAEQVNVMTFDLLPKSGVQYQFDYRYTADENSVVLSAKHKNKMQQLPMTEWHTCDWSL